MHASTSDMSPDKDRSGEFSELLAAVGELMLQHVFSDRKRALSEVARLVGNFFAAEHTAIFLVTDDGRDLTLDAWVNILLAEGEVREPPKTRWRITNKPGAGFTSNLASNQVPARFDRTTLRDHEYGSGEPLVHLQEKVRHSLLVVPLFYRKPLPDGRRILLGILKCENKLNSAGRPDPNGSFTDDELHEAEIVSKRIVAVVENLEVFDALGGVLLDAHEIRGRDEQELSVLVLKAIIDRATKLVRANRGDFAWRDLQKRDFVFAAKSGDSLPDEKGVNEIVPDSQHSLVGAVFEDRTKDYRLIPDTWEDHGQPYFAADPSIRSELAVRVDLVDTESKPGDFSGTPVAVINVESLYPNWFDDRDVAVLRQLARHTALAIQVVKSEGLMRRAFERKDPPSVVLGAILDTTAEVCGFDEGIIYQKAVPHHEEGLEPCIAAVATRHGPGITDEEAGALRYPLDEKASFGSWVVHHGAQWRNPEDSVVNQVGRKLWAIDQPMLGYPLKVEDQVVGVMVLWTRGRKHASGEGFDLRRIEPFSRLAAAVIGLEAAERELRESEHRFKTLVNGFPIRFLVKRRVPWDRERPEGVDEQDPMLVFEFANEDVLQSLKLRNLDEFLHQPVKGELKRTTDWTWFKERAHEYYQDDLEVMRTGEPMQKVEQHQASESSRSQFVRVWKAPERDSTGAIIGVRCVFWDRTQEQHEEDLKDLLLEELPHRLRRCLRHVGAFLGLESQRATSKHLQHVLRDCQLRIQTMETVQNTLEARTREPVVGMDRYLGDLVPKIVGSFRGETGPKVEAVLKDIEGVKFPPDLAFQTGLVVTELVSNAMNHAFAARGGRKRASLRHAIVWVKLQELSDGTCVLSVGDNGCGMDESKKKAVASDSLGLQMVRTMVESQWRGTIQISQRDPADGGDPPRPGTQFTIRFSRNRQRPLARPKYLPQKTRLPRVLVVEDQVVPDGMECNNLLRSLAYEVVPDADIPTTVEAALHAFEHWKPDAVVLDIELESNRPGEQLNPDGGITVAEAIRAKSSIPIVFLTGREAEVATQVGHISNHGIVIKGTNIRPNLVAQLNSLFAKQRSANEVFICYSHKDSGDCLDLGKTLRLPGLGPEHTVQDIVWDDTRINPGVHWREAIEVELKNCAVAVLLISKSFLSSAFIRQVELPRLLDAATARGTRLLPVGIETVPELALKAVGLAKFQFVMGTNEKPVPRSGKNRGKIWNAVFEEALQAVHGASGPVP